MTTFLRRRRWRLPGISAASFLTTIAVFSSASAIEPSKFTADPLYQSESMVPLQLNPIQIAGTLVDSGEILAATALGDHGIDCRVMRDPWRSRLYLLKCLAPESVDIVFHIKAQGVDYFVKAGPFVVSNPPGLNIVNPPPPPPDPLVVRGGQLFGVYCARCHNPEEKAKRTALQITNAINNPEGKMSREEPRLRDLSTLDIQTIERYLREF